MSSLDQLLAECAALLRVGRSGFTRPAPNARSVVLVLIDGLGALQLREFADHAPALSAMTGFRESSGVGSTVFPSTTATALASLGTGLDPGEHGLLGSAFWVPEIDRILMPLKWGKDPNPLAMQPEPTGLEAMAREGVNVVSVGSAAYRESGLTQAALRGARYVVAEPALERIDAIAHELTAVGPTFVYCYWQPLDRIGHEHGVGSPTWLAALREVDDWIAQIAARLETDQHLVVTADHGMVTCPPDRRIQIQSRDALIAGVRQISGDPRARHVYVAPAPGRPDVTVATRWGEELAECAAVVTRDEAIDLGWFGRVDEVIADRIGDVVAVACEDWSLASTTDHRVSGLIGQHGGMTPAEMLIPLLHAQG